MLNINKQVTKKNEISKFFLTFFYAFHAESQLSTWLPYTNTKLTAETLHEK